jgi:gas vesicle protein
VGEAPDEIRREIEQTRARMTETVEAIGHRADVPRRAKEAIVETKDSVVQKGRRAVDKLTGAMPDPRAAASRASEAGSSAASSVGEALPSREQMQQAVSVAQSNPLGLMIGAAAVGFVVGLALPTTRVEDEKLGELADDLKEQAREAGHDALQHGKEVAQQTARAAASTAQEAGREHGEKLAQSVQQRADDITGR